MFSPGFYSSEWIIFWWKNKQKSRWTYEFWLWNNQKVKTRQVLVRGAFCRLHASPYVSRAAGSWRRKCSRVSGVGFWFRSTGTFPGWFVLVSSNKYIFYSLNNKLKGDSHKTADFTVIFNIFLFVLLSILVNYGDQFWVKMCLSPLIFLLLLLIYHTKMILIKQIWSKTKMKF